MVWKTPFTLSERTRSQAASSNSSSGAPQVFPALFTSTCSRSSRPVISSASARHPDSVDRSAGTERQTPTSESSVATASHGFGVARRDVDPGPGVDEATGDHPTDPA